VTHFCDSSFFLLVTHISCEAGSAMHNFLYIRTVVLSVCVNISKKQCLSKNKLMSRSGLIINLGVGGH
jgi:hypothetical protein